MGKKTFLIDVDKCTGCQLCIVACKDEHVDNDVMPWAAPQPDTGHFWMDVVPMERGQIPRVRMTYLPLNCQHCENAPCMKVCPEGAIKRRDDGLVWIDPETCTGCGLCQDACPYGVIYMNGELDVAQKCTGCAHRVDEGLEPRCSEICPHEAIVFGEQDEVAEAVDAPAESYVAYLPEHQTLPLVRWKGLPTPDLAGSVVDPARDELVVGAAVRIVDLSDDSEVSVVTDAFGEFRVRGLTAGRKYLVKIEMAGYEPSSAVVSMDADVDLGDWELTSSAATG